MVGCLCVGIMRCAAYSASVNRYVFEYFYLVSVASLLISTRTSRSIGDRPLHTPQDNPSHPDSSIQHFYDKLLHIREQLKTEEGKRLAEKRHQFVSANFELGVSGV